MLSEFKETPRSIGMCSKSVGKFMQTVDWMSGGKLDVVVKVLSALSFTPQVNILINYINNN